MERDIILTLIYCDRCDNEASYVCSMCNEDQCYDHHCRLIQMNKKNYHFDLECFEKLEKLFTHEGDSWELVTMNLK